MALRDDPRRRVAHLLRRAGFGGTPAEIDDYTQLGFEGALDKLLTPAPVDAGVADALKGMLDDPDVKLPALQSTWVGQMVTAPSPLQEKMTLFLHGLLTSGAPKVREHGMLWRQNELFRQYAFGNYRDLLKAVGRDPAMLVWLDGANSHKAHPNENYARELMELFSLGIGNYTEQDVQEAARAFTGWTIDRLTGEAVFNRRQFDPGPKTIFGQTGTFDDHDVVDLITKQDAAPGFLAGKLLRFFVTDTPDQSLVDRFAGVIRRNDFELKPILRELFLADEFSADGAYRAKIKSPTEFAAGLLKHLGVARPGDGLSGLMHRMGQDLFAPPNVAGWPGGKSWISTSTLFARFNAARGVIARANLQPLAGGSAAEAADRLLYHFLDGDGTARLRAAVTDWLTAKGTGPAGLKGAVHLVVGSPTYQLN